MELHEQLIALVTGANKGRGRATAELLAAQGATTVLPGARDHRRGQQAAVAMAAAGGKVHVVTSTSPTSRPPRRPQERSSNASAAWASWSTTPANR